MLAREGPCHFAELLNRPELAPPRRPAPRARLPRRQQPVRGKTGLFARRFASTDLRSPARPAPGRLPARLAFALRLRFSRSSDGKRLGGGGTRRVRRGCELCCGLELIPHRTLASLAKRNTCARSRSRLRRRHSRLGRPDYCATDRIDTPRQNLRRLNYVVRFESQGSATRLQIPSWILDASRREMEELV